MREQPGANDVTTTHPRRSRAGLRSALLRAAGVGAVAVAVLLAVLLWPGRGGRTQGVVGHAVAGIGDRRVMHVVVQTPSGFQFVELDGDRTTTPTDEVEMWADRSSKRWHSITREQSRAVAEWLSPEDDGGVGEPDPAFEALWTGYRNALDDGTAKLIGEGSIYGHRVYWLQFPLPDHAGPGSRVAVDRDSYRPVAYYAFGGGKGRFIHERVLLAGTVPFSDSDFRRRTAPSRPLRDGTRVSTEAQTRLLALGKPWLSAGKRIQGVSLASAVPLIVTTGKRRSRGVELSYGFHRSQGGEKWIQIDEGKRPTNSDWRGIPKGFVKVMFAGEDHSVGVPTKEIWSGHLVVNGIYVAIETDLGRDTVLAVARTLKPV